MFYAARPYEQVYYCNVYYYAKFNRLGHSVAYADICDT